MSELRLLDKEEEYDIICITESKPKRCKHEINGAEFNLKGFNMFANDLSKESKTRGCII